MKWAAALKAVMFGKKVHRVWTENEIGRRLFPRWFEKREAKRRARREREKVAELVALYDTVETDSTMEVSGMLQGKLTYIGIAATALGVVLGWVGLGDCTPEMISEYGPEACEQAQAVATSIVDKAVVLGGTLVAVAGRIRAGRREKALREGKAAK